jgi:ComF family protein
MARHGSVGQSHRAEIDNRVRAACHRRMSTLARAEGLRRLWGALLDVLLPPRCLKCGETVGEAGTLCARCWRGITFLGAPCCACCGLPFDFDLGAATLCGLCSRAPPPWDRARAVMRYDEESRRLVLALKHGDRLHLAPALGAWMRRAGAELLDDADMLVPVPLHWTRLLARRYNQSAVLAQAVHAAGGPPVAVDGLVRRRRTPSQGKRNAEARRRNVQGAFRAKPGRALGGKRIVLIDDVFTTGATVGECARVLRRAGALRVDVLTVARTVRQEG